jgi:aminocarboxymuconate-semialdehyde decarboxylase
MMPTVDVHAHFIPPDFIASARRGRALDGVEVRRVNGEEHVCHPQGYAYPLAPEFWDMEAKLRQMDRLGIDITVLSIAPPLLFYWVDPKAAAEFCRGANEAIARLTAGSGGRLYGLATVPMQDPEAAAAELRYAVSMLGLKGAILGTSVEGTPLEDERFEPFWAVAEALEVPILLHPYYVGPRPGLTEFYLINLIGNPLDTSVAAARLILSGFLDRHPRLRFLLVHGGGFLPYQIGRLDHGFRMRREAQRHIRRPPSAYLDRFYFDTVVHADLPLRFLVGLVGCERVMVGTDLPFDMADVGFHAHLNALGGDRDQEEAIRGRNACRLFRIPNGDPASAAL